jgi:hypothetical protein
VLGTHAKLCLRNNGVFFKKRGVFGTKVDFFRRPLLTAKADSNAQALKSSFYHLATHSCYKQWINLPTDHCNAL